MRKIILSVILVIACSLVVNAQVNRKGLLAAYKFDNNYRDSTANKRHALYANTKFVADRNNKANSAVELNGETGFITSYIGSHENLTVAFWFNPSNQVDPYPHLWDYGSYSYRGMILAGSVYGPSDRHRVYSGTNFPTEVFTKSAGKVTYNQWQHIAFVFDKANNKIKIYVDGSFSSEETISSDLSPKDSTIMFGRVKTSKLTEISTSNFVGAIDDIYIYDRPLSAQEITDLKEGNIKNPTLTVPDFGDESSPEDIVISPNPTKSQFTIQIKNDAIKASSIKVFDITGKLALLSYDISRIDVSTLKTGTYIVHVIGKNDIVLKSEKIIKK